MVSCVGICSIEVIEGDYCTLCSPRVRVRGVPLGMSSIHPECPDSDPSDRSVAADVLLRQEPDEEEEEEDEDDKEDDDDDNTTDDGYSE